MWRERTWLHGKLKVLSVSYDHLDILPFIKLINEAYDYRFSYEGRGFIRYLSKTTICRKHLFSIHQQNSSSHCLLLFRDFYYPGNSVDPVYSQLDVILDVKKISQAMEFIAKNVVHMLPVTFTGVDMEESNMSKLFNLLDYYYR